MNNSQKIIIYSTPDCAYCYTVKDYLHEKGIQYEEINIYEDEEGRKKMEELSGQQNVPVTIIGEKVINGWNKKLLNEALDIQ